MSTQGYDQSNDSGPWINFKEHIYPSKRHRILRQHHATEVDDRGKPKKRFLQFHAEVIDGGCGYWKPGAPDELELYVKPEVQNVIHVEGEACADFVNEKLREAGLKDWVATTSPGGSKNWRAELAKNYKGKHVYGSPDWAQDGYDYISEVMKSAKDAGAMVRKVVEVKGEARGDDLKDWLQRDGNTIQKWIGLTSHAWPWKPDWKPSLWEEDKSDLNEWDAGDDTEPIPPRGWLLGNVFCRRFVSSIIGDGGTGKTALRIAQALSLATCRPLTGEHVFQRCRVLIVSLEDDRDELRRRVKAAMKHHEISQDDLKGWLFLSAPGRAAGKLLTVNAKGSVIDGGLAASLRATISKRNIDVVILDPFVKTHGVEENQNSLMDEVVQILANLATESDIVVDIPHHTSKGRAAAPGDADRGRGATAVKDAARLVYTLTTMSMDEAEEFDVAETERRLFFRIDPGKVNITPPARNASWFRLVGVALDNSSTLYPRGDNVQTVEQWTPPETFEGVTDDIITRILDEIAGGMPDGNYFTAAPNAKERAAWEVVQKHIPEKSEKQCRGVISAWLKSKALTIFDYENPATRKIVKGLKVDKTKRPDVL